MGRLGDRLGRGSVPGALLLIALGAGAQAQEVPLSVTYGSAAAPGEGDPDYREVMLLSVPDSVTDRVYLRVFDPETGGDHDLVYGTADETETRFRLFGGDGATAEPPAADAVAAVKEAGGTALGERLVGSSAAMDGIWQTLFAITPETGEALDGRRFFRLEIDGTAGNDANLYSVTLSLRDRRNLAPEGVLIQSFAPTARVPDDEHITELRFQVPADAGRLTVRNFDAANADVRFVTRTRSVPLAPSGQDEWRSSEIAVRPDEQGELAAIVFSGGSEIPNDVTFEVQDETGGRLALELPARLWRPNARPRPEMDVELLANCFSVAFDASRSSDPDGDQLSYAWSFGDGATGTGRALVHTYPSPGSYDATLRILDSSGQVGDGAERTVNVFVKRAPTAIAGDDLVVAPGEPVVFDGSASRPGERPIARYSWDFGDGAGGDGAQAEHVFDQPGRYTVELRVEDDTRPPCNVGRDRQLVRVNAAPVAVVMAVPEVAVGEPVSLDGSASYDIDGEIVTYRWDLGDGTTASGPTLQHAYAAPGIYTVRLHSEDNAGVANSQASAAIQVVVNAPPVAAAGPDRHVAIGEVITFDGSASRDPDGTLIGHGWSFGDGASGSGETVQYAYRSSGVYRVTLSVRDDSGTANGSDSDTATVVVNEPPVAEAGDEQVVSSSEVRFDGTASVDPDGSISRYEWDFGDGSTGQGARPVHVYRTPGTYHVRLTVTDDSGTRRNSASDTTRVVVNAAPIADAGPDLIGAPGQKLSFLAGGSIDPDGDVAEYVWSFKDGASGQGATVTHAFDKPGIYQVRLSVKDDTAQANAVDYDEAKVVINAAPVARAGPDRRAAPGDAVTFDAGNSFDADGGTLTYRWDFSDQPEPTFGAQVVRAYASPGVYTVQLTVTDDSGAANAVARDEAVIRINHQPSASAGQDITTWENTVTFDGTGSADADGDALTYLWDFGDGTPPEAGAIVTHTYAEGGLYPVVLTVDDGTGLWNASNTAAINLTINRSPVAVAGANRQVCATDVVVFDGSASRDPDGGLLRYRWDFGDGTSAEIVNPTKTYNEGAAYPVTLTVEDESGFPNDRHTDRIVVKVDESPVADAGPDQEVCAGTEVHFDGSGSRDFDGVVDRYTWDFGDETAGGGDKPVHVYSRPGDYRVTLTIEGGEAGQCDNTDTDDVLVRVVEAPSARIDGPRAVATGVPVTFDGGASSGATGEIRSWRWDLGDGTTAEGPVVRHIYEQPGSYVVRLELETDARASRCDAAATQQSVVANAAPVADPGEDLLVGVGQEVPFDGSGATDPDGAITSWLWDFGDGTTAAGMLVRHRFTQAGRYPVTLTVTDDAALPNSTASETVMVEVNAAPEPRVEGPVAACPGAVVALDGLKSSDADGGVSHYAWRFGDGATAEGAKVEHSFTSPGRYPVALVVDDGQALNNSRQQAIHDLHVNAAPRPMAGPDRTVCPGADVTFDAGGSLDWDGQLVRYEWNFGDGESAQGEQVVHRFERPGQYDVQLSVTDDSGSSCATASDVARVHVNAPPVAVAGPDLQGFTGGAYDQLLFDGSGSSDPDGQPLSFLWDMGDGVTRTGEKVLHTYGAPQTYTVRLGVSDGTGLACGESFDQLQVDVRSRAQVQAQR